MLFVLGADVDDDGVNPLPDQTLHTVQAQLQQTVLVLRPRQRQMSVSVASSGEVFTFYEGD